jgi:hypothetical protein
MSAPADELAAVVDAYRRGIGRPGNVDPGEAVVVEQEPAMDGVEVLDSVSSSP